jgi:hypothetical protein
MFHLLVHRVTRRLTDVPNLVQNFVSNRKVHLLESLHRLNGVQSLFTSIYSHMADDFRVSDQSGTYDL